MDYKEKYLIATKEIDILKCKLKEKDAIIKQLSSRKRVGRKNFDNEMIIRLMYDMYLSNNSLQAIADFLNKNSIKTKNGSTWGRSSIRLIINKEENLKKFLNEEEYNNFFVQKEKRAKKVKK